MLSGMQKKPKRPRDPNQLGKLIVDLSVGEADDSKNLPDERGKDPAAGGLGKKGGKARAKELLTKKKTEIGRKGSRARWLLQKFHNHTFHASIAFKHLLSTTSFLQYRHD